MGDHEALLILKTILVALLNICAWSAFALEHRASTAAEIEQLSRGLQPGDVLVLAEGTWKDQRIVFQGHGTAEKPITLRAATPGKVILVGESSLTIDGDHLVVSGLCLTNGRSAGEGIAIKGRHCRVTASAVVDSTYKFFVRMWGTENRLDHCYLAGKTSESPTLQVETEDKPNRHRIDHNHFGPRPPLRRNGGETIRVGYSWQSMSNSATLVEQNLFDRCDGEIEIISNKSCENIYRFNTFKDCAGMFTLRHGNRCVVEGNFFFGNHKRGSGGIRVIGEDHLIFNNYIESVEKGGFWITAGISNSPLKGYFQSRNCLIAFNTFVDSRGPAVELDAGFGSSGRTLRPENITIANNVFSVNDGKLLKGIEGKAFLWMGNLASALAPGTSAIPDEKIMPTGIRLVDLKLVRAKDGLYRPLPDSPVRRGATVKCAVIKTDIDGQRRPDIAGHPWFGERDVGCDQTSTDPVTNRPLTAADVGPSWMNR